MKKNILKVSITVIVTIGLLSIAAWTLHSKGWYHKMNEFYQYPEDYEVWFLGSSHVIMSTLPEELYHEYGIRSYNLADYGQTFAVDYWVTKNLFEISKPKLVVLDVAQIVPGEKYSVANLSGVRRMISSLPFSKNKLEAINDLFEGDLREEMLLPFAADHNNWEFFSADYFRMEESYELGSDQNVFDERGKADYMLVTPTEISAPVDIENVDETETLSSTYFRKLIELCEENDVEVLLVKCPLSTDEDTLKMYNYAFQIGQEYNVLHLNGFELTDYFDGDTDMWDTGHMNSYGGRKWTHALGQFISDHYPQIETSAENEQMNERWDARYEKYLYWLDTELPLQSYLYSFLMLCANPRYTLDVSIKNNSPLLEDKTANKFIENSSGTVSYIDGNETIPDIKIFVKLYDGQIIDSAQFFYRSETSETYERQPVSMEQ